MTHSTAAGEDRWQRLGALLIQRRTALDPRYHNRTAFSEATGLNYRVVYDIEEARRANFGTSILAAIEAAYRLEPGAIGRFLAGGELEPQAAFPPLPRPAPPARRDVDFSGGDPEGLRPWRQQVLREVYSALGIASRFGPGDVPEPSDLPGVEDALAALPGARVFRTEPVEADTWDDPVLSLNERLTLIAVMRRLARQMDEEENRQTGLSRSYIAAAGNYRVTAAIAVPVPVALEAGRASS